MSKTTNEYYRLNIIPFSDWILDIWLITQIILYDIKYKPVVVTFTKESFTPSYYL